MVFTQDNQATTARHDDDATAQDGESAAAARLRLLRQMEARAQQEWKQLRPLAVTPPATAPSTLDLAWDMGLDGAALQGILGQR